MNFKSLTVLGPTKVYVSFLLLITLIFIFSLCLTNIVKDSILDRHQKLAIFDSEHVDKYHTVERRNVNRLKTALAERYDSEKRMIDEHPYLTAVKNQKVKRYANLDSFIFEKGEDMKNGEAIRERNKPKRKTKEDSLENGELDIWPKEENFGEETGEYIEKPKILSDNEGTEVRTKGKNFDEESSKYERILNRVTKKVIVDNEESGYLKKVKNFQEESRGYENILKRVSKEDILKNEELDFWSKDKKLAETSEEYREIPYKVAEGNNLNDEELKFWSEAKKLKELSWKFGTVPIRLIKEDTPNQEELDVQSKIYKQNPEREKKNGENMNGVALNRIFEKNFSDNQKLDYELGKNKNSAERVEHVQKEHLVDNEDLKFQLNDNIKYNKAGKNYGEMLDRFAENESSNNTEFYFWSDENKENVAGEKNHHRRKKIRTMPKIVDSEKLEILSKESFKEDKTEYDDTQKSISEINNANTEELFWLKQNYKIPKSAPKKDSVNKLPLGLLSKEIMEDDGDSAENVQRVEPAVLQAVNQANTAVPTAAQNIKVLLNPKWQLHNQVLRQKLSIATKLLANFFHEAFKTTLQNIGEHSEYKLMDYIINPCEVVTLLTLLMSGMANTSQIMPSFTFTQAAEAEMTKDDLINAVSEYLYGERYDKSTDDKRQSLMDIGLFTRAFPIHQQFKQQAEFRFKSKFLDFTGKGNDFIKGKLKDYVKEKTEGLIPETPPLLRVDFDLRIVATTLMRGNWSVAFAEEEESRTFYCFEGDPNKHSSREYRMKSNTKELRTDYHDFGDRFAVYLPFENGNQGILFYVPKNLELFKKMDNKMDFRSWNDVLAKLDQKFVKIIFPTVSPDTERDIEHDWTEQVGIPNIFVKNAINYTSMTTWNYLFASNFIQRNVLKFEKNGMRYVSVTFLTLKRDHEAAKEYGNTRVIPRTQLTPIPQFTNTSDQATLIAEGPTTPAYLSGNSDRLILSAKSKTDIKTSRTLKDKSANADVHFQVLTIADYKRCTSKKAFWSFIRERKIKCGSAEIERNCSRSFLRGRKCKEKKERAKNCKRVSEACKEYLSALEPTATLTSTEPSEEQVTALIDTPFFYAIINRDNGLFYSVGKVSNCS